MLDINLDYLAGGELGEQFQSAINKVVDNMLDPNTPYKNKRGITIKLTFEQNEERNDVSVGVQVETKLSPRSPMKTNLSIGKDLRTQKIYAKEYGPGIKGQYKIEDYDDGNGNIRIEGDEVDPETGEIVE